MPCCSRDKFVLTLRPAGLFLLLTSLIMGISAMVKAQYIVGVYEYGRNGASQRSIGLFTGCDYYSSWYCGSVRYLLPAGIEEWQAAAAMFVLGTMIQGVTMIALLYHFHLALTNASKRAFNIAIIVMMSFSLAFSLVALSIAGNLLRLLNSGYYISGSWTIDTSMIIAIVAFVLNIIGSVLYAVGWKMANNKLGEKDPEGTFASLIGESEGVSDVRPVSAIAPQQVSININGQTVTAMLIPGSGNQSVSTQPPASAPSSLVYMPDQSYVPPQPSQAPPQYVQHFTHYPAAEASNTTYV